MPNSFNALSTLQVDGQTFQYYRLDALREHGLDVSQLPFSLKILLENLLRHEDGVTVTADDIKALAAWDPKAEPDREIAFRPSRVLLQDFTGRAGDRRPGGDARRDEAAGGRPQEDQSAPAGRAGDRPLGAGRRGRHAAGVRGQRRAGISSATASATRFSAGGRTPSTTSASSRPTRGSSTRSTWNTWPGWSSTAEAADGQRRAGVSRHAGRHRLAHDDDQRAGRAGLGRRRHRGRGGHAGPAGLDAGAAGRRLQARPARCREGATATDLVLTVTQMLRKKGVVGKFVEYYGNGLAGLPLADRATIANMAPEYGATCGLFPIDAETIRYLELTGRPAGHDPAGRGIRQGAGHVSHGRLAGGRVFRHAGAGPLDRRAEPGRPAAPQDRVPLSRCQRRRFTPRSRSCSRRGPPRTQPSVALPVLERFASEGGGTAIGVAEPAHAVSRQSRAAPITNGSVVIAAITSCTNTSNPSVMVAAGLLAKKAVEQGLRTKPWVKASLAPGSKVVTDYLHDAGLDTYLDQLRFNLVGYGCTTCIGNSGPLPPAITEAIQRARPGRGRRPVRQPQLRGTDQPGRAGQLPGLASAGRRLRPGRHDGHRLAERAARLRSAGPARSS